jgi:cellulose synthase/poly-beta-1,6-N-acetylglucosamine synthase-like glycosyltransferase
MEYILFFTSFIVYFFRAVFFIIGSKRGRLNFDEIILEEYPNISVIVPAKNEQDNIGNCVNSILESNYPIDRFEIIVVNDQSTDDTASILNKFESEISNLRVITITQNDTKTIAGKPGALDKGIEFANGEFLLFTDADCTVDRNWIDSIAKTFKHRNSDLVASFTLVKHDSFFSRFQAVEWLMSHTMASGGIGLGFTLGCFGNNMAISKKMYEELGGYKSIPFSVTEDLALLQAVDKANGKLEYICTKKSTVVTKPLDTVKEYLKQRKRWALGGRKLGWKAVFFVITSLLIWISAIVSLIVGNYILASTILLLKIISDIILIIPSLITVKEYKLLPYILPSSILFLLVELLLPILILDKKVEWKGNTFDLD